MLVLNVLSLYGNIISLRVVSTIFRQFFFFFQAEDGIRALVRSRGLGDVYKRQTYERLNRPEALHWPCPTKEHPGTPILHSEKFGMPCLLYTSDAADDLLCGDLGGRRILKQKKLA